MATLPPGLEQFIRSVPLFSLVSSDHLMEALRLLRPVQLATGEVLFQTGEPGRAMWVLGPGSEVQVSNAADEAGKPVVLATVRAGETLGDMALVDEVPRSGTAVVSKPGPAHQIYATDFHALRQAYSPVAFQMLRWICLDLCRRLRATNDRIRPVLPPGKAPLPPPRGRRPTPAELDEFPAFRPLPHLVKLALEHQLQLLELPANAPLFAEGDVADAAYLVLDGELAITRGGAPLATQGPGSMVGLVSCLDEGRRSASVGAGPRPTRLLRLSDESFDVLFASGHRFAFMLTELIARQLVLHVRHANQQLSAPEPAPDPGVLPLELDLDLGELDLPLL